MNAPEAAVPAAAVATDHFIPVPETRLPNGTIVPAFRVGQYVCTQGADGQAAVTAEGAPWVNINFAEAKAACIAAGYQLLTELQWLSIAHQVAQLPINWNSGVVGKGRLVQGLRQDSSAGPQPGSFIPDDPDEQRFFTLSNGELICDLNGNVFQWVFDDVQGDAAGLVASAIVADSPSLTTAPFPSMTKGMGWRPNAPAKWSGGALVRGGYWDSEATAGAFRLYFGWPGYRHGSVGFRCTQPIGL